MRPQAQHKLTILGSAPGIPETFEGDVWVFNYKASLVPGISAAFQMHQKVDWGSPYYIHWLQQNRTVPIYMRERHVDIPMSTPYPFDEVFRLTSNVRHRNKPLEYFTSSITWAIALAVLEERPLIDVYGIEMYKGEYKDQADCFAFWIGFSGGRGIELNINCADAVFDKPLYGAQPLE